MKKILVIFIMCFYFGGTDVFSEQNIVGWTIYYGNGYTKSNEQIYYFGEVLKNSDANTFEKIWRLYAKDKDTVYYKDELVLEAHAPSFKWIWSKEGFEILDPDNSQGLAMWYAYDDKNNYYHNWKKVGYQEINEAKDRIEKTLKDRKIREIKFYAAIILSYILPMLLYYILLKKYSRRSILLKMLIIGIFHVWIVWIGTMLWIFSSIAGI